MNSVALTDIPGVRVTPLDAHALSRDPAVVDAYARDPAVYHGKLKVRTGFELMGAMADARAAVPRLSAPILILHGDADRICLVDGSRALAADAARAGKDVALKEYPGHYHELFNERDSTCLADAIAWMEARLPAGGGRA